MKEKEDQKEDRTVLYRSTARHAAVQLLAVCICSAVLFLFVALTYSQLTLPKYTAKYKQKDAQQVVNLIITVVATVIGILLSHCRRLTNEAETRSELRNRELTIPRLHVHFEAAGGSKAAMSLPALHNRQVWALVAIYLFTMIVFGFINSVLSVVFVIDPIISDQGFQEPAYLPLSIDIPETYDGKTVDPCSFEISLPGCAYDLALTTLSSQLVTYTPYTVGGVTFDPLNGTLGMPYYAMKHFSDQVQSSVFEEERRTYCLPVLDPHIVTCTEEPFNQARGETNSSLVRYEALSVSEPNYFGAGPKNGTAPQQVPITSVGPIYKIIIDYPNATANNIKFRTNDQSQGVFLAYMNPNDNHYNVSILTGSNNSGNQGYATLLHQMMYGVEPDLSGLPTNSTYYFVAKCEMASIKYRDNYLSSWRLVDFTLQNGVLRANATEERCPNPRGPGTSGFDDLYFAFQGAGAVLSSTDGYSKLFNVNPNPGTGTPLFANMSALDAAANKIVHTIQTAWSQSIYQYAMKNQSIYDHPVMMTNYAHLYIVRISWTPTTYIGLVLSLLITLNAYMLAGRWARATYRFGFEAETWNLLRPVDLMAYSLAAYQDLIHDLNTGEHRRSAMHGTTRTVLRERPVREGTQSLISLVTHSAMMSPASSHLATSPVSNSATTSPASAYGPAPTSPASAFGPAPTYATAYGPAPTSPAAYGPAPTSAGAYGPAPTFATTSPVSPSGFKTGAEGGERGGQPSVTVGEKEESPAAQPTRQRRTWGEQLRHFFQSKGGDS